MKPILTALLASACLLTAPAAFATATPTEGTHIELRAVPDFLQHVFVPVVPGVANSFVVTTQPIAQIISVPEGYHLTRTHSGLRIDAPSGDASGYARVRLGGRELTLTLVNLIPSKNVRGGFLEGYHVGNYVLSPLRGLETYRPPKGFIRLTSSNGDLQVSDHYRLRDFQCKLDGSQKFVILRTEALMKLELLQHELAVRHDLTFHRFTIMSGYRTPFYNSMIGNETSYSRHLYGDAMDIYIDEDGDGQMDDINGDGTVDVNDARFLMGIAEAIDNSQQWGWLKGGAGIYHATRAHGPYLHVDARGYVARWGL
jgi:hypothetical protein